MCRIAPDGLLCVSLLRRSHSPRPSSLVSGTPHPNSVDRNLKKSFRMLQGHLGASAG